MKKIDPSSIPLKQRHLVAIAPGFFFADDTEMKWPKKNWEDPEAIAKDLAKEDDGYVAFRRFIYDPEEGKVFLDKGWVYFGGKVYKGKDILAGKADFPCSEIGMRNIENNGIKEVVWFHDAQKMYPLDKEDKFIGVAG